MESELSRVIDALPGLVWTALPDGRVDYVNQGWCEYTGLNPDDACALGWQAVTHPTDVHALLDLGRSVLLSGEPGEMEAGLRHWDGEYRRFILGIRPMMDTTGKIIKWCGMGTEIEDGARVENGPHPRNIDLRAIVDSIPAFIGLTAPSGEGEYFNRFAQKYLGLTLDELKGWKGAETVHPEDRPSAIASWKRAVETGEPYEFVHRVRRADGIYRWFHARGLPLRDSNNHIAQWFIVDADIDDETRNTIALAGENRLLETVMTGGTGEKILEAVCLLAEETIGDCYASIELMDASGTRLESIVAPHLPARFIATITDVQVDADSGPCPMAISLNQQIIATDLATETRWTATGWPAMALSQKLQACWATPIVDTDRKAHGALAIYFEHPRSPTSQDRRLIQRLCHMAGINIQRQRSKQSLAQAVEQMQLSEDRLRAMIDTVPGFVWRAGPDGGVEFLNQRWCDYTGISLSDSLGIGWTSRIHPDDAVSLGTYWQVLLGSSEPGSFEARLRRFDGSYRWFLIRAVPLLDDTGRIVNWYGQNTDIDDRKRAELLLEGEKRLLRLMAGSAPLPEVLAALCELVQETFDGALCNVILTDPRRDYSLQGTSLRLVPGAAHNMPATLFEEADGRPLDADISPLALSAMSGETVFSADLEREHRWGAWCSSAILLGFGASHSAPIKSSCGTVIGVLSILHCRAHSTSSAQQSLIAQFTHLASIAIERTRAMAALKRSEAFLAKAQQLSSTGALSWCVETNEITWSDEIYGIYELDPALPATFELIDTRLHPEDITSYHEAFRQHRLKGEDFEHEHRLQMSDGRVKYLHLVAHATKDDEGHLEYIAAVQDVTQRQLSEEALGKIRSELAHVARVTTLGALTASIAHEVNQPLAGIITNANTCLRMLAADPPNIDGARETARRTIRDGNRASDVIKRLRALFAKKTVTVEGVDLNEAAREVIAMLMGELQRNGVTLQPDFTDDLPLITGDRVQLQQVILNLIMNAVDAMNGTTVGSKHMRISTARDGDDRIRFAVRDNGAGFDPHDADRLFHAFYTTKDSGMGIGLSVSRAIIESHDGLLWAQVNDGYGATFAFSLPSLPVDEARSADPMHGDAETDQAMEGIR